MIDVRAHPLSRAARRAVVVAALAGAALVAAAPAASAHSVLVRSSPAAGSTVTSPLTSVSLTFNENVRAPAYVVVTGPGGERIDDGAPTILDATVTEHLKPASSAGSYTIGYRVVSADGHPVEAQLTYTLGGAGVGGKAAAVGSAATPPASGGGGGHWIHILGGFAVVLVGVGALVFERLHRRAEEDEPAGR